MTAVAAWERSAAETRVRELLEVSVPDGLLDDDHAAKLASKLVDETLRTLGLSEQHNVRVSFRGHHSIDNMHAPDLSTAREVAERMALREDVERVSTNMRWCSPWHRT